jgi:hypothetical protein
MPMMSVPRGVNEATATKSDQTAIRGESDASQRLREANARELADIKQWVLGGAFAIALLVIENAVATSFAGQVAVAGAVGVAWGGSSRLMRAAQRRIQRIE